MARVRFGLGAAAAAVVLGLSTTAGAAARAPALARLGTAGASSAANCLAHVVGGQSEDWYDVLHAGLHRSRRAGARSRLVRAGLSAEHHVARRPPGRWRGCGVERRADILVRRHGQGHEPHQDRRRRVPGVAVLPGLDHDAVLPGRRLPDPARGQTSTRRARLSGPSRRGRTVRSTSRPRSTACSRMPARRGVRHARPRHRRRAHLGADADAAYQEQVTDETSGQTSSRARAQQPGGRPADARVQHAADR